MTKLIYYNLITALYVAHPQSVF